MAAVDETLHLRFDASTHADPSQRVAAWRDAFSASVDVGVAAGERAEFCASATFHKLGPALLADTRYTDHTVTRDRRTVARTGSEQVILDLVVEGAFLGTVDGRPCRAEAGDCFLMDMRGTFRLHLARGRFIGFIMPRSVLGDMAAATAPLHGLVLPAGTPVAILLGALLTSLVAAAPQLTPAQIDTIGRATIELVATLLGEARAARSSPNRRAAAPPQLRKADPSLVRLRRHIERHAADPTYNPDVLARAFDLSRSRLYRLYRPQGGVAGAIRRFRADLALQLLTTQEQPQRSLREIAAASGWSHTRALKRALRAIFDASPDELRGRRTEPAPGTGYAGLKIAALFDEMPR